jgi:hypothetical protein
VIARDVGATHLTWDLFYTNVNYGLAIAGLVMMRFSLMY